MVSDRTGVAELAGRVPALLAERPRDALAGLSARVYGYPSNRTDVAGITGTSGKTTTSFLVRAGLAAVGLDSALLGTVGTFVGAEALPAALTTPEAPELQALLAVVAERGIGHVVMEVSSHALAQHRVDGVEFAVAAFTPTSPRITSTSTATWTTTSRPRPGCSTDGARRAVITVDDEWGARLAAQVDGSMRTVRTVRTSPGRADWTASDLKTAADGEHHVPGSRAGRRGGLWILHPPVTYNATNALLALAVLAELGVDPAVAAPAIRSAQVPGRMERIDAGQPFLAVVDYSHKPAAVLGALQALRPLTTGQLTIVLGCGGDRDRGKRPIMGEVAARSADRLIVTDDNPRSEDPAAIRAGMLTGALALGPQERGVVEEIGDRAAAIAAAVDTAGPGDTVLIAGKGHETGQEIAGRRLPFDDRDVLRRALADRVASA